MITPTWEHYGTHDDSEYPELWDGCIGAWAPCLGPSGAQVFDLSGAGNNGSFVRLSPSADCGMFGGMSGLDQVYTTGTTVAKYVQVRAAAVPAITSGLNACSVLITSAFKSTPPTNNAALFFEPTDTGGYTRFGLYQRDDNSAVFVVRDTSTGGAYSAFGAVPTAQIITLAGTYNAANDFLGLFCNGVLLASNTSPKGPVYAGNSVNASVIGAFISDDYAYSVSAHTFDVRLYNRELRPEEVRLYNAVRSGVYSPRRPRRFYSFADALSNRRRRLLLSAGAYV